MRMVPDTPSPCFVIVIGDGIFPLADFTIKFPWSSVSIIDESIGEKIWIPFIEDTRPFLESIPEKLATATFSLLVEARETDL